MIWNELLPLANGLFFDHLLSKTIITTIKEHLAIKCRQTRMISISVWSHREIQLSYVTTQSWGPKLRLLMIKLTIKSKEKRLINTWSFVQYKNRFLIRRTISATNADWIRAFFITIWTMFSTWAILRLRWTFQTELFDLPSEQFVKVSPHSRRQFESEHATEHSR